MSVETRLAEPVTPVRDLTVRAFNPDGTTADPDALARLNAILNAHAFLGVVVQAVTR